VNVFGKVNVLFEHATLWHADIISALDLSQILDFWLKIKGLPSGLGAFQSLKAKCRGYATEKEVSDEYSSAKKKV
jgi:hypothetical protein